MSLLNGGNGGCGCAGSCSGGAAPEADALNGAAANGTGTSRRRFLKVLGTSGAGAATLAACGPPNFGDKLIPSLVEEEGITPGVSDTYATVLADAGPEPVPVHAQVRDGRVLGLSPNDRFGGGTNGLSSLTHSTLQDLYDPDRLSQPIQRNPSTEEGAPPFQYANWEDATAALTNAVRVGGAVLLTGRVTGTTGRFMAPVLALSERPVTLDGHPQLRGRPFGDLADSVHHHEPAEYWKSAPYLVNFMEGYKLKENIVSAAADGRRATVTRPGSSASTGPASRSTA